MKKIIVLLILCLLFACSIFVDQQHFSLTNYFSTGTLHIYTKRPINQTSIPLASIYMSSNADGSRPEEIIGESLYFENLEVGSAITTLKAKIKFTEYIDEQNLTLIYAHTNLINKYEIVNGVKINLQISTCDQYSVIGWPLIYGSF